MTILALVATVTPGALARAQNPERLPRGSDAPALTLAAALELARSASPDLEAARQAVSAAAGRARQAHAIANPILSYEHERTSSDGQTNSQNIASLDQPIALGTRGARVAAARLRHDAALARLKAAESQLDFDVTRSYAFVVASDRRAALAQQATEAFSRARSVSDNRLVAGDVSGYANRRIRLEAARYAGLLAEAQLTRRRARFALASLIVRSGASALDVDLAPADSSPDAMPVPAVDSLHGLASVHRAELRAVILEAEAAAADARLVARERTPIPTVSAGLKNERVAGGDRFNGFVAGVSLPLPVWDRRRGAVAAANADARREVAEVDIVRRQVVREVEEAAQSLRAVDEQLATLRPHLGAEAGAALHAAQVAYSEGEISLVEWLDAVRAYQEAESTFAGLRAESVIRRAALERAVGVPLSKESR